MNKVLSLVLFTYCLSPYSIKAQSAQKNEDLTKIEASENEYQRTSATIETYFEGWMTGDTSLLGAAMHRTCQLKNIKDNDVVIYDREKYLSFFKPRPRRENAGGKILYINITDDIASAKCEIHTKDRLYTDYFNMMKIEDRWYIVDKISSNKER